MKTKLADHTESSGNVYEDLGFVDTEERLAKAKLAMCIGGIIDKRKLTQIEAAKILDINQPKISALVNGRLSGFSIERLFHFLLLLNQDIDVVIKTKRNTRRHFGRLSVAFG